MGGGEAMSYHLGDGIKFLRSLQAKTVDGIFTDPPWGPSPNVKIMGQERWTELLAELDAEAMRILKPGGRVLIWVGMRQLAATIKAISLLEYRWTLFVQYIPMRYIAALHSMFDPILFYMRPGDPLPQRANGQKIRQLYQKVSRGQRETLHPCARPFSTVKNLLSEWFDPGEYVVDPFAGSDTTGRASLELGLRWDSWELDPMMYKTGLTRHAQLWLW